MVLQVKVCGLGVGRFCIAIDTFGLPAYRGLEPSLLVQTAGTEKRIMFVMLYDSILHYIT